MNEDLNDILYDIDMQLYDEFNDKIATMNDYLGDVYSLRDVEEVENAQKEREIELLRIAIVKQQKEIESLKEKIKTFKIEDENIYLQFGEITEKKRWQDKIKAKVIEVKDRTVKDEFITASQGKLNTVIDMESLLEKE